MSWIMISTEKKNWKKEVSKLKDLNEDLCDINYKNVEVYQKVKAEMYELQLKLETIERENIRGGTN